MPSTIDLVDSRQSAGSPSVPRQRRLPLPNILAGGAAAACILLAIVVVPWHMDEFVMFHPLACLEPSQQLNVYRDACGNFPTQFGPLEFHRAHQYIGITSSLLLAPFHALSHDLWVVWALGVVALLVVVVVLTNTLGLGARTIPIFLLWFPLTLALLHDGGGPVRVGLVVMVLTPVVLMRFVRSARAKPFWLGLMVILWIVAAEDKPFFMFLIPGIIVFSIAVLVPNRMMGLARASWRSVALLFGAATSLSALMLFLMRTDGVPYLQYLSAVSTDVQSRQSRSSTAMTGLVLGVDWPYQALRVTEYPRPADPASTGLLDLVRSYLVIDGSLRSWLALMLTLAMTVTVCAVIGAAVFLLARSNDSADRLSVVLFATSAVLLWIGAVAAGGWTGHHFVYLQVPLLGMIGFAFCRGRYPGLSVAAILSMLFLGALAVIALLPVRAEASREIPAAFAAGVRSSDSSAVINCASWGCYYAYSLLNQGGVPVVFADTAERTRQLERDMSAKGLRIIHICMACGERSVQALYPDSTVTKVQSPGVTWHVYSIKPPPAAHS